MKRDFLDIVEKVLIAIIIAGVVISIVSEIILLDTVLQNNVLYR